MLTDVLSVEHYLRKWNDVNKTINVDADYAIENK